MTAIRKNATRRQRRKMLQRRTAIATATATARWLARPLAIVLTLVLLFTVIGSPSANTSDPNASFGLGVTKVGAQSCAWGDIICELQQAIQQLLDPLKEWAMIKANVLFYGTLYELIHHAARFLWAPWKGLYSLGVGVGSISEWIGSSLFQPMIQSTNAMTQSMISVVFFLALIVLGCTYVISSVIRLRVVNPRSAFLWLAAISFFFQLGPGLFAGMFDFRRALNTYMLATATQALAGQDPFGQLSSDDPEKAGLHRMSTPCNNFTTYFPGTAGTTLNGLDIGLAHLRADGYDVLNGGAPCGVGTGSSTDLPRSWYEQDGYFDLMLGPVTWEVPGLSAEDSIARMQSAVQVAIASLTRLINNLPLVLFGILEQIISLCLVIAIGLTFISFSVAALFAFFERTEPIAWAVVDQWISLIVQMVVIGLLQAMVLALYVSVAKQPNPSPLITLAISLVGLFIYTLLLWSAVKSIMNAFNRLFDAIGRATGARVTPGETAGLVGNAGMAMATGGMSLVGSAAGGLYALSQGATWSQAAGSALGNNRALDGAAWQLTRLPGVQHTAIGEMAEQFVEGAAASRAGQALLGAAPGSQSLGRLAGPTLGSTFLTNRNQSDEEAHLDERGNVYWQAPLLNDRLSHQVAALTTSPAWAEGEGPRIGRGGAALTYGEGQPVRQRDVREAGRLTNEAPASVFPSVSANPNNAAAISPSLTTSVAVHAPTPVQMVNNLAHQGRQDKPGASPTAALAPAVPPDGTFWSSLPSPNKVGSSTNATLAASTPGSTAAPSSTSTPADAAASTNKRDSFDTSSSTAQTERTSAVTAADLLPAKDTAYQTYLTERASSFYRDTNGQIYREDTLNKDSDGAEKRRAIWRLAEREELSGSRFLLSGEQVVTDLLHGEEHVRFRRSDGTYERQRWQLSEQVPPEAALLLNPAPEIGSRSGNRSGGAAQSTRSITAAETDLDEQFRDDLQTATATAAVKNARPATPLDTTANTSVKATPLETASSRLEQAAGSLAAASATTGDRLSHAADAQMRATAALTAQQALAAVEGRLQLQLTGPENIATMVGRILPSLQLQNATTPTTAPTGVTADQVSRALLGAAGIPVVPVPFSHSSAAHAHRSHTVQSESASASAQHAQGELSENRELLRFTAFVDKAMTMGLNGTAAERVIREVKAHPAGQLTSETRHELINQQHEDHSLQQSVANVTELENLARQVPEKLSLRVATPPPTVNVIATEAGAQAISATTRLSTPIDSGHIQLAGVEELWKHLEQASQRHLEADQSQSNRLPASEGSN